MHVIPVPASLRVLPGEFRLPRGFAVHCLDANDASLDVGRYLLRDAERLFGLIPALTDTRDDASVVLQLMTEVDLLSNADNRDEGYALTVSENGVTIEAETRTGMFYGVQTFFQCLPFPGSLDDGDVTLECVQIVDWPRFGWRGVLLDVGRHFFDLSFIKHIIDHLAFYKLNRFHWHLTEDQGWRIEIKAYPRLTEMGAWRPAEDGDGKYGGFYTQHEISEIISYAKERCIEVVPEIEMPGHCTASLAGYPSLSCQEEILETPAKWGVYEDVYCAGKDEVIEFLKDVMDEVVQLFPFEYVHIGGDEVPKDRWKECARCQERIRDQDLQGEDELQSWFISELAEYLASKDRKIIGWDEILEGGVPRKATVMSWRGMMGGFIAAKLGHDVIMCPTAHCYFDYRQSDSQDEPGAYYATLSLEDVFAFEPIPDVRLLARTKSHDSDELQPSSSSQQMEVSEMSEVTTETGRMDDEAQHQEKSDMESHENGHDAEVVELRPEQKLAEEIQNGRHSVGLTDAEQRRILGGQANVWTEYIEDEETCEYMMLPRLCAFSETVWSPKEARDLESFYKRLDEHIKLFDALDFKYRPLDC